jgi:hypothetical protein
VLALLALIGAASLLSPYFFDLRNVMNVLRGASLLCIVVGISAQRNDFARVQIEARVAHRAQAAIAPYSKRRAEQNRGMDVRRRRRENLGHGTLADH